MLKGKENAIRLAKTNKRHRGTLREYSLIIRVYFKAAIKVAFQCKL